MKCAQYKFYNFILTCVMVLILSNMVGLVIQAIWSPLNDFVDFYAYIIIESSMSLIIWGSYGKM